jgi:hypothetical protein
MTWLEAEMMVERNKGVGHSKKIRGKRKENRYYFCERCKAYHVTSSDWHFTDKDYASLRSKNGNEKEQEKKRVQPPAQAETSCQENS